MEQGKWEDTDLIVKESYVSWEKQLLFTYNARRNRRAWQKLPKGDFVGTPVVVLGQFETSGDLSGGFGHLNAYSDELILVDVLDNESTAKHAKSR